jgi:hypothetical protein
MIRAVRGQPFDRAVLLAASIQPFSKTHDDRWHHYEKEGDERGCFRQKRGRMRAAQQDAARQLHDRRVGRTSVCSLGMSVIDYASWQAMRMKVDGVAKERDLQQ